MNVDEHARRLLETLKLVHSQCQEWIECHDIGDLEGRDSDDDLMAACLDVVSTGKIRIWFPGEDEDLEWGVDDFVYQGSQCKSLTDGGKISLRTADFAVELVTPVNDMAEAMLYHSVPLSAETSDGAKVKLVYQSLLVGIRACQIGAFHRKWAGAVSRYTAIEVGFGSFAGDRTEQAEVDLIDAFLFELASSHNIVFKKSGFDIFDEDDDATPWLAEKKLDIKLRPLEASHDGVRLYLAAGRVEDSSLRFFSFYKVLEHFAPNVLNLEAHEGLRKKLDSPEALSPGGQFIREILQLSKGYDLRKNDRDLIKGVLLTCVDLVGLNPHIPTFLRKPVTYETNRRDLDQYCRELAECICATRNQVAHARATYEPHGTECPIGELPQLNEFMQAAAAQAIRWYNHLPDHQKSELAESP